MATSYSKMFATRIYLNCPGAAPNNPPLCLLAALDGAKPNNF